MQPLSGGAPEIFHRVFHALSVPGNLGGHLWTMEAPQDVRTSMWEADLPHSPADPHRTVIGARQ